MNRVAVVILNYNSSADCEKCVKYLSNQTDVEPYIIIVDNCSSFEETEKVRKLCLKYDITFIRASDNRGYSAGNNIGLKHAVEIGYKYVMIANPDMEFHQTNYLSAMVNTMRIDSSIAVCASDIIDLKGRHQNPFYLNSYWDDLCLELWKKNFKNNIVNWNKSGYCNAVHGCCMLLNCEFLKKIGFLDEKTFLYCEERILSKSVSQNHYKIYYYSGVQAIHNHVVKNKGNYRNNLRLLFKSRNYYYEKYTDYDALQLFFLNLSWAVQLVIIPFCRKIVHYYRSHNL